MAKELAFTVRLSGEELDKYIAIRAKLSKKIPKLTHTQIIGVLVRNYAEGTT